VRTTTPNKDNSLLSNMKNEIETLKSKLKAKEVQLNDNLLIIENIQGHLKSERGEPIDLGYIKTLQKKAHILEQENLELRESLHSEVLVSERQRSELEIVKEALNNQLGGPGMIQKNNRSSGNLQKTLKSDRPTAADVILEYERLIQRMEQNERDIVTYRQREQSYQAKLKEYEEENAKLSKAFRDLQMEKQKLREDNENSLRMVSTSRQEQKKLEEEKQAILSFMNGEYKSEKTQLYNEINQLKSDNARLVTELNK
jgi:hypothetical protein